MKTLSELKAIYSELIESIEVNETALKTISRREKRKEHKALSKTIREQQNLTFDLSCSFSDMARHGDEFTTDSGYLIDFLATK